MKRLMMCLFLAILLCFNTTLAEESITHKTITAIAAEINPEHLSSVAVNARIIGYSPDENLLPGMLFLHRDGRSRFKLLQKTAVIWSSTKGNTSFQKVLCGCMKVQMAIIRLLTGMMLPGLNSQPSRFLS